MTSVAAYVPDLMDRSRLGALGASVRFVQDPDELADADEDVVIVDLSRPGALDAAVASTASRRIGFIGHAERSTIVDAREAGIDAMPRSRFFSSLPDLIDLP